MASARRRGSRTSVLLLALTLVLGLAGTAAAHGIVDQASEGGLGGPCWHATSTAWAQTFTPTVDNLTGIDVHLGSNRGDDVLDFTIRDGGATGGVLATVAAYPLNGSGYEWYHVDLAAPIALVPGNTYTIRIDWVSGNPCWSVLYTNPYPGGQGWYPSGYLPTWDLNFRTYYQLPDGDGDGVDDGSDNCPLVPNPDQSDLDRDGLGDVCDKDRDGDGVHNFVDNCPSLRNPSQGDRDRDGIGNRCDPDRDGDLVLNDVDNCPGKRNATQRDRDGDGIGNRCDPDRDGDLVLNTLDNCPRKPNPAQRDRDGDGIGNRCDPDKDGDGVLNRDDAYPWHFDKW